jgi:regulatory protein
VPSEKSGNEITKIKVGKVKITVVFKAEELKISPDTYTELRLYEGKVLSDQELAEIKAREQIDKLLKNALVSVSKGHPTKKALIAKLEAKGASRLQIDKIIEILTRSGLLDDQQFLNDYLEYAKNKGYGKERILQGLYEKGVPHHLIQGVIFDYGEEFERAENVLPNLEQKFLRYNYVQRKRRIYEALLRLGYESGVAIKLIDKIKRGSEKDEFAHLRSDLEKARRKYEDKGRKKIVEHLLAKGYRYKDIAQIMAEEQNDEMD